MDCFHFELPLLRAGSIVACAFEDLLDYVDLEAFRRILRQNYSEVER